MRTDEINSEFATDEAQMNTDEKSWLGISNLSASVFICG
jgi:hypothetical protein